jgi:hypothetical protein
MLDKRVLKTKENPARHRLFLPQEVVWHEVWIGGFYKKDNYIQWSPRREM